jgi:hypothetical protein
MPASLIDPATGKFKAPGDRWASGLVEIGNDQFGASYDAEAGWGVPGVEEGANLTFEQQCNLGIGVDARLLAKVWALGSAQKEIIDFDFSADSVTLLAGDPPEGHLEILEKDIWGAAQDIREKGELYIAIDLPLLSTMLIPFLPVSVSAGVSGKASATFDAEVTGSQRYENSTRTCVLDVDLVVKTGPDVQTEAFVEVAGGAKGVESGISGSVVLGGWQLPIAVSTGLILENQKVSLTGGADVDFGLHTLDGDISLFVEVPIRRPLVIGYSYPIFEWDGVPFYWHLFNPSFSVPVPIADLLELMKL